MPDDSLFDILEGRNQRGFYPFNENHWSNVLAWLLKNESVGQSLLDLLSPGAVSRNWKVEREIEYVVGSRRRFIDIHLSTNDGVRLFVEVKIDPAYQDREQIEDQLSLLRPDERFVIVAPLDLSSFVPRPDSPSVSGPVTTAVTWRTISLWCGQKLSEVDGLGSLERSIMKGVKAYWSKTTTTPFEQMVETILDEQQWSSFYPDDFKEVFLQRFPEVWAAWVAEKPAQGNGNPHQYLMTCLSMLANRKNGFRLARTGRSRPPKPKDWGYPTIYELAVMEETQ